MSKVRALFIWLVLFVGAAMLIGSVSSFIPSEFRRWLSYAVIALAIFLTVRAWSRWRTKEAGDRNEIEWLYEVVEEQERGKRDNRNLIRQALPDIEREHQRTPELEALLRRARQAIAN